MGTDPTGHCLRDAHPRVCSDFLRRRLTKQRRLRSAVAAILPAAGLEVSGPHPQWIALVAGIGFVTAVAPTHAENWRFTPSASITETYTSNVNAGGFGPHESDFVTSATATLQIAGAAARLKVDGSIGATGLFYARSTADNTFAPMVNLTATLEAIEQFLFIEAQANVTQTFVSAFGAQPGSLVNATNNRYTSQTYRLSPYVRGRIGGTNFEYLLRDDSYWTLSSQYGESLVQPPDTYLNHLHGTVSSPAAPVGYAAEYDGTRYESLNNSSVGTYTIQVVRGIVSYQIDPQVLVSGRVGYESDRFPLTSDQGPVFGVGGEWSPTERMQVKGFWEHRFFGSSYSVDVNNRLPRVALSAHFSRGLNTYPQNALSIPAGADVASFVDAAFRTRIPDPTERAIAVQQFIAQSGLPPTLATPVNVFSASVLLQTSASASMVLIGARNSLGFTVFYLKSNAISGTGTVLPDLLQFGQNNTQTGGGASFNHQLTGFTSLTANATYSRTRSNDNEGPVADVHSANTYLNVGLATRLGPRTTMTSGVGYTRFEPIGLSNLQSSSAFNAYVGLAHTF